MRSGDEWQVLLVDDDSVDRQAVRRAVRSTATPIVLYEAETLLEAREVLSTAMPDCVLVDMQLPDGEGLELVGAWPNVPFIVLTGYDDLAVTRRALQSGAQDYLIKGQFDAERIERSIRYAVERKLHEATRQSLAHQDRLASLGRLAASVAHEINNPTAFVAANLIVLREHAERTKVFHHRLTVLAQEYPPLAEVLAQYAPELGPDDLEALVRESVMGVERIVNIVRQLGSFARRPDEDEPLQDVSLTEVASWACMLIQNRIRNRATLIKELDTTLQKFVGRPGRLAQVATNLVVNAAQALPDGLPDKNMIWVRTRDEGGFVSLTVEDTGSGFSAKVKRRAFEPFFTTKPQGEGTGLGLAIASDIVRAHGGEIVLEDRVGGGARVTVRIPKVTTLTLPKKRLPSEAPESEAKPLRILLVDDEAPIRRAYRRMLKPHEVVAEEAGAALERLIEDGDTRFDLILCDLMMPGIDGMSFYEHVVDVRPELADRIVFCTGGAFEDRMRDFLESVPNRVLEKPASKDSIIETARAVLRDRATASSLNPPATP